MGGPAQMHIENIVPQQRCYLENGAYPIEGAGLKRWLTPEARPRSARKLLAPPNLDVFDPEAG